MKKALSVFLALVMCLTLGACGKSKAASECENQINPIRADSIDLKEEPKDTEIALEETLKKYVFELSKEAYTEITYAYNITQQFGADVYKAWFIGATQPAMIQQSGVAFLANDISLSEDEIKGGLGYFQAYIEDKDWDNLSEVEKQNYVDNSDSFLKGVSNSNVLQTAIYTIPFAYIVNGKAEQAQTALDNAKKVMRELSESYSDYEHYPSLKGYYTATVSYFEFCQNPKGTFEMLETTINEYMNDIRDYSSDLDFIFGE